MSFRIQDEKFFVLNFFITTKGESTMPSPKILEQKKLKVEKLTELLKNSAAGVLVDYKGINVEEDTKLRKQLRESNVNYFVEKNTILSFAFKNLGLNDLEGVLEGSTAIGLSTDDQTAPARVLGDFAEKMGDTKFNLKAGFIGSDIYDAAGVQKLSKIPSKDILLAQLVGSLQGPIQKLAATLQAVVDKKTEESAE